MTVPTNIHDYDIIEDDEGFWVWSFADAEEVAGPLVSYEEACIYLIDILREDQYGAN